MSVGQTIAGGVFFVATLQAAIVAIAPSPPHQFLTVHEITQDGPQVSPSRTIHGTEGGDVIIADWGVTVVPVGHDAPTCQTIPGRKLNEGWSKYTPGKRETKTMHLDFWVGDPGCWDRLAPGEYIEFTTWTSRDGSRPVRWQRKFSKGDQ